MKEMTDKENIDNLEQELYGVGIPILDVADNISMVPLIGIIDSSKTQKLMEDILYSIKGNETKVVILDIFGISIVDSAVAAHLIKITKATQLMGCETIISGISPEVAQSMVSLGVDTQNIVTTSTLKNAILQAYKNTGLELKKVVK